MTPPSTQKQIGATFAALCLILLTIGGLSFFGLRAIERHNDAQQFRSLNKLAAIDHIAQDAGVLQVKILRQILEADPNEISALDQDISRLARVNAAEIQDYQKLIDTASERRLYQQAAEERRIYWAATTNLMVFSRVNDDARAIHLAINQQLPYYDHYVAGLNELIDTVESAVHKNASVTSRYIAGVRSANDILVVLAIGVALAAGLAVARVGRTLRSDNRTLQSEIQERKKAEQQISLECAITRSVAESATAAECAGKVLEKICQTSRYDFGALWLVDHRSDVLRCEEVWPRRSATYAPLADAIAKTNFAKGVGLPGRVWTSGQAAFIPELQENNFVRFPAAHASHLRRAFAIPLITSKGIVGVAEFFSRGIDQNDESVLRLCANAGSLLGQALELKRVQEQLFHSQKMETVGKLAGGIAHEFNSIMTAIIGQSEMMLHDLPSSHPLTRNASEISKAADRAAGLTRQLLAYGRKQILNPEVLDLNKIVTGMENMLHHLMGNSTDVLLAPGPGNKWIKADAGQLEQVIMNIAMNAVDAMPNGGKLTLETSCVPLDDTYTDRVPDLHPGAYVMLAITDTGTGMSDEVKAHVFEPFFTTKGIGKGTGLGLSTCQGIVKQSNGHITVYSEAGRGATFKIYLPQVEPDTAAPIRPAGAAQLPTGGETILMVEDDPALREMASGLLERLGYRVLAATDGLDALHVIQRPGIGHVDLLFTDVVMPHMSGKELSERIRSLYPRTKILFTSAYTENAIVHQGVLSPGIVLLQKPFTPGSLARKIRDVLDGK